MDEHSIFFQLQDSHLLTLPLKIQTHIISSLLPSDIKSVRSLLYVCKQLYSLALPFSVHTFCNGQQYQERGDESDVRARKRNIRFLRYILIDKPFLAKQVKSIILGTALSKPRLAPLPMSEKELYKNVLEKTAKRCKVEDRDTWVANCLEELGSETQAGEIALLLAVCYNLEDLCLGETADLGSVRILIKAVATQLHRKLNKKSTCDTALPLQMLRTFYLESKGESNYFEDTSRTIKYFFRLPGLLSCEFVMPGHQLDRQLARICFLTRFSAVEHLTFRQASVGSVGKVVALCSKLVTFEYISHVDTYKYDGGNGELTPKDLLDHLLPHHKTLEYLHLRYIEGLPRDIWERGYDFSSMGPRLTLFTALKTLMIGMESLIGFFNEHSTGNKDQSSITRQQKAINFLTECLPSDLEHLEIHYCGKEVIWQVQQLLNMMSESSSYLRRLKDLRLLFKKEYVDPSEIKFTCKRPSLKIEVVYQNLRQRVFDSCPNHISKDSQYPICTRIYDPTSTCRKEWLAKRGSDKSWMELPC